MHEKHLPHAIAHSVIKTHSQTHSLTYTYNVHSHSQQARNNDHTSNGSINTALLAHVYVSHEVGPTERDFRSKHTHAKVSADFLSCSGHLLVYYSQNSRESSPLLILMHNSPFELCPHFHNLHMMYSTPASLSSVVVLAHCTRWVTDKLHTKWILNKKH